MVTKYLINWKADSFKNSGKMGNLPKKAGTEARVGTLKMRSVLSWGG